MKAIILDVDGTLWDTTGVVAEAWMQAASELMIPLDTPITADRLKQEFGKPMDEIAANLFPTLSESQRALVMESCCEYEEFYLENAREHLLFDGVKETILTLSQNYAVCIVSNCQKGYIELFLKKTGLENAITDFECFGNTGLSKGENIRLLMERAQITDAVYGVGRYERGMPTACSPIVRNFRLFLQNTDSVLPLIMLTKSRVFQNYWNIPFKKVSEHCPLRYFSSSPDNPDMHALSQTDAHMYPLL